MKKTFVLLLLLQLVYNSKETFACPSAPVNEYLISTDKATYKPGQAVLLTINKLPLAGHIRYWHLNNIVKEETLTNISWSWQPPLTDFKGYLVEVYTKNKSGEKTLATIAVDVSSDLARFPRNGFLSTYGSMANDSMAAIMKDLNRYHMNIVQFQDWMYKHHLPLAGTIAEPQKVWKEIANRDNYKSTIQGYISLAHKYSMETLSYNLIYGALDDADADGVKREWYMYKDSAHNTREVFPLPKPPFKSDIYFVDPSNTGWQNYIAAKTKEAYAVYKFDGYQVDQVGNRDKILYNYSGKQLDLPATFKLFLEAMRKEFATKRLIMNAVNQYGQENNIAKAPVDFLYTEVWTPNEGYKDLAATILNNDSWCGNTKKSVLCAYMNYDIAGNPGFFNTPAVLLTDAVIFSFGGSHLELGEHMLGREYFPNNNLQMKEELKKAMLSYYDFLTAYENLLRDGGTFNNIAAVCTNNKMIINTWPPQKGNVSIQGKMVGNKQVLHLINFANAIHLDWRDTNANQTMPELIVNAAIDVPVSAPVKKVWVASPDSNEGKPQLITFTQSNNTIHFTLPQLKYWNMIVIE